MIEYNRYRNNVKKILRVYENYNEFKESGETLQEWEHAQNGDYILTSNGYYVPISNRREFPAKPIKNGHTVVFFGLPNGAEWHNILYSDSGKFRMKTLLFERDWTESLAAQKKMSAQDMLMLTYLEAGASIFDAFRMSHPKRKVDNGASENHIKKLLRNPIVQSKLKEKVHMDKLLESFNNNDMTDDWLTLQLKKIVENEKTNATLRWQCIETIIQAKGLTKTSIAIQESEKVTKKIVDNNAESIVIARLNKTS